MRIPLFLILFSYALGLAAQPINVYCLPGQGADRHLFDSLQLGPGYRLQFIEYGTPQRGIDMATFAQSLLVHLDTTAPFVLLGTSLGGMLSCELAEITDRVVADGSHMMTLTRGTAISALVLGILRE